MSSQASAPGGHAVIVLRDVEAETDAVGRTLIKWRLELRQGDHLRAVVARSTTSGLVCDVQPLGNAAVDWPAGTLDTIAARIGEELARAKLARILRTPAKRRAS